MEFTNDTKGMELGEYYLLEAPSWTESCYVIAQLERFDGLVPVFTYEADGRAIPDDDVNGWCYLTAP